MRFRLLTAASLALLMAAPAWAAEWKVDPAHSTLHFKIEHLGINMVYGRFNDFEGSVTFDPDNPEASHVVIAAKTASVDTGVEARDEHLRSADFLEVETYPEMRFESAAWKRLDEDAFAVTGTYQLHGVAKVMTVTAEFNGTAQGMRGETRAGFSATFTIDRTEFGVAPDMQGIGQEVEITVAVEVVREETPEGS